MNRIEITICKPNAADIKAAQEIGVAAWSEIHNSYKQRIGEELHKVFFGDWKTKISDTISELLTSGQGFVAKYGNLVVGYISYSYENNHTGSIGYNAVHTDFKGLGIGGKMYEYIFDRFREKNIKYVKVITGGEEGHQSARRAYEKAGFSEACAIPRLEYYKKL